MPFRYRVPNDDETTDAAGKDILVPRVIYPNAGGGFGWGLTDKGYELRYGGYAYCEGYDRSINMTDVGGTLLTPSFAEEYPQSFTLSFPPPQAFLVTWTDSTGTIPIVLSGMGKQAIQQRAYAVGIGTLLDNAASPPTGFFSDGCQHDDGAGTVYLYAGTVTDTVTKAAGFLLRRTLAGVWAESATVKAKRVLSAGTDFYICPNDYQIQKFPSGNDPFTASPSATYQVGTNAAKITALGQIGGSPIVAKEDGIYTFNATDGVFEPALKVNPHPKNFPFIKPDGTGGVYTAAYGGGLMHIEKFGSITVYEPLRDKAPGRDTPRTSIVDAEAVGDSVYCLMSADQNYLNSTSITVSVMKSGNITTNPPNFTDYSTQAQDKNTSSASVVDVGSMDIASQANALLVGFTDQFFAMNFLMQTANTVNSNIQLAYSTGFLTWTSVNVLTDETAGWQYSGTIAPDFSGVDLTTWTTATYNGITAYWMKLTVQTIVTAGTAISTVGIVGRRGSADFGTTNSRSAGYIEASGGYSKILRLHLQSGSPIWDDVYTLKSANASKILLTPLPAYDSRNASLFVSGPTGQFQFAYPTVANPNLQPYPILSRDATSQLPPVFYPSAIDMGGVYSVKYIEIYANNMVEYVDSVNVAFAWDDNHPWYICGSSQENYSRWNFTPDSNKGTVLHTAIQLLDGAATEQIGPNIRGVVFWLTPSHDEVIAIQPLATTPVAR